MLQFWPSVVLPFSYNVSRVIKYFWCFLNILEHPSKFAYFPNASFISFDVEWKINFLRYSVMSMKKKHMSWNKNLITGYSCTSFPVFCWNILWKISNASSFLPRDMRNLGLSGKSINTSIPPKRLGIAQISKKMCHECSSAGVKRKLYCKIMLLSHFF